MHDGTALLQPPCSELAGEEGALDVDSEQGVEFFLGHICERLIENRARIVDQIIDWTKFSLGDRKEPFRSCCCADIRLYRQSLSTIAEDCGDNVHSRCFARVVVDYDFRRFAGELRCDGRSNAPGRPGDDSHLSCMCVAHFALLTNKTRWTTNANHA